MTKVGQPRDQLNPTFSDKSPLFDWGSGRSVQIGPMHFKCMPNLGSIRVVAVKHHPAPHWEPHLTVPSHETRGTAIFFRFFPKTGFAKGVLGKKLAFFPVLGSFSRSLQRTAESDGGDLVRVAATLSPDDSEFLTAAHRRVVLRAPLEPFFIRARHHAARGPCSRRG